MRSGFRPRLDEPALCKRLGATGGTAGAAGDDGLPAQGGGWNAVTIENKTDQVSSHARVVLGERIFDLPALGALHQPKTFTFNNGGRGFRCPILPINYIRLSSLMPCNSRHARVWQ